MSLPTLSHAQNRVRRNVEVEWDTIENATQYEVQVIRTDDANKKPLRFKTQSPQWSATIKPGLYKMQVRSYDDRGVPGSWSPESELLVKLPSVISIFPEEKKIINAKEEDKRNIEFKWETVPGAEKYRVKAQTADSVWTFEQDINDTKIKIDVPVGAVISWEVVAINDKGEEGDRWKSVETFEVYGPALKKPVIEKPFSKFVKELKWSEATHAQYYKYDLKYYNRKSKKWDLVESKDNYPETTLKLDTSRPTGMYKIAVQAVGEHRKPSNIFVRKFTMMGGFRDPASLESAILVDSITKPTNFYVIASYFTTQVQYEAHNYDANTKASFGALGAVGRLGFGYQNPKSKWGAFAIADMSAFIIGGGSHTFTSLEAHATRRYGIANSDVLLLGAGIFSKEIPIVVGSQDNGYISAGKVSNIGPHAGFTYWTPITDHYGFQLNGRIYYTLSGSGPSGKTHPAVSYLIGGLGSYRLSTAWMGYLGYAYRVDQTIYATNPNDPLSFAGSHSTNDVTFRGHFLNLMFEYSF
ncbi:MAG: hypothetical protein H6623_01400 [Bdellovibrionaceae bacterium]|nr:hypothetical protein [Pseudobdellovibrionaceae bacterium]